MCFADKLHNYARFAFRSELIRKVSVLDKELSSLETTAHKTKTFNILLSSQYTGACSKRFVPEIARSLSVVCLAGDIAETRA